MGCFLSGFFPAFRAVQLNRQTVDSHGIGFLPVIAKTFDASFDQLTIWCTVQDKSSSEALDNDVAAINDFVAEHAQFLVNGKKRRVFGRITYLQLVIPYQLFHG